MTTIIVNTVPEDKRCKTCKGWGTTAEVTEYEGGGISFSSKRCEDCNGTGWAKPKPIEFTKIEKKEEKQMSYFNLPTSIYPQTEPKREGWYLVFDETMQEWRTAEWKIYRLVDGEWAGGYDVRYFIPYRLLDREG